MNNNTITKFKFFWPDQDLEQEQWLREMARQGLHLKGVNSLSRWTFVRTAPADVIYRVDFNGQRDGSAFHQLFRDAGWEYAAACTGWQYWRKAAAKGQAMEIFTDSDSKTGKFRRLLLLLAIGLLAQLPLLAMLVLRPEGQAEAQLPVAAQAGITVFAAAMFTIYVYMTVRLLKRVRGMRDRGAAS